MKKVWRIAGSVLLLGVVAWRLDFVQVGSCLAQVSWVVWAEAVAVYVAAQMVSCLRWRLLSRPLGFTGPWRRFLAYYFIGVFFNLVLPTSVGGDVVRAWYLAREGPGRRRHAVLSVLADRLSGLAVLVLLGCVAALVGPPLPGWLQGVVAALAGGLLVAVVALPFLRHLRHLPLVGSKLGSLIEVAQVYRGQPRLLAQVVALAVVVQLANAVMVGLLGQGLGLQVPAIYYGVVGTLVPLLTLLPVSVNGLGLREVGVVVLLVPQGVPQAQAVTLSLVWFVSTSLPGLLGVGFYLHGGLPRYESGHEGQEGEPQGRGESRRAA